MILVVMGVSGSGKTTIGTLLADAIHCSFLEGDSLHSKENIEKMSHGLPLTDSDRAPWLAAIRAHILKFFNRGEDLVIVCSALKQQYRDFLAEGVPITWVYLKGSEELIRSRMKHRLRHFMKVDMLPSQFEALEEPSDAIVAEISPPPGAIVAQILAQLQRPRQPPRELCGHPRYPEKARARMKRCETIELGHRNFAMKQGHEGDNK